MRLRPSTFWHHALLSIIFAAVLGITAQTARAETPRIVPQLEIISLWTTKVAVSPVDPDVLLVVDESGLIHLFDRLKSVIRTAEIAAFANDAAFSAEGDRIVSGGRDGTVRLWTLQGEPVGEPLQGHEGGVSSVAIAGDRIVSGGDDGTVRLWTLQGGAVSEPLQGHEGGVASVAIAGDRIVSGGRDGTVRLWTLQGEPVGEPLQGHEGGVSSVAIAGERIVSGGPDGTVRLWTLQGEPVGEPLQGHEDAVWSVAIAGERIVSGGLDGTVRLWTLQGEPVGEPLRGHFGWVTSVAIDGDRIVSGSDDGTVRLWTLQWGQVGKPLRGNYGRVFSVAITGERIISGSEDGTVRFWTLQGEPVGEPLWGHSGWVLSLAISGERIVSGSTDGTVRLWTLQGEPVGEPLRGHPDWVWSVAGAGERIVSASRDGTVRLWTLQGEAVGEPLRGHPDSVSSVAIAGERIVTGGSDGRVRLWTLQGEAVGEPLEVEPGWVTSVAIAGERIVSGGDQSIKQWTLQGEPVGKPLKGHEGRVSSLAISGDRIVSASYDGTVRLWTLQGEPVGKPLQGHEDRVQSVAIAGERIVSGSDDGTVRLWMRRGEPAGEPLQGQRDWVSSVTIAGDRIVSGGRDGTVRLWTLRGEPVGKPLQGHEGEVSSVAIAGDRIVSGGEDGTVRLWTLQGEPVGKPLQGHEGGVASVAIAGDRIVSGGDDGTVRLWTLRGEPVGEPLQGHEGGVSSVAIAGERIVSGGDDGTVQLWTLQGEPVGKPLQGHESWVWSVAIAGERIVSGGEDGTVRLWTLQGEPVGEPLTFGKDRPIQSLAFDSRGSRLAVLIGSDQLVEVEVESGEINQVDDLVCPNSKQVLSLHSRWALVCNNSLLFLDRSYAHRGSLYLNQNGMLAHVPGRGVFATTGDLLNAVKAFGADGRLLTNVGAVPTIGIAEVRQSLLGEFTATERVQTTLRDAWDGAKRFYERLDGWVKGPFLLLVAWTFVFVSSFALWTFAPARLARLTMPVAGAPKPPPWIWLAKVLSFYGWLGSTRRPLQAWLREARAELQAVNFSDRTPVVERRRYAPIGYEAETQAFGESIRHRKREVCWLHGIGGSGKSALAFEIARRHLVGVKHAPVPILLDADWTGTMLEGVTALMRLPSSDRTPTAEMVQTLGAAGLICPILDSLSERGMTDAVEQVGRALASGEFRHMIITSRSAPPNGPVWQGIRHIEARPLRQEDVSRFVEIYAPQGVEVVIQRISTLVAKSPLPSPLFLRFAIEQAALGELKSTDEETLVLSYVEALRTGRVDLTPSDMRRAACLAAAEAVGEDGVPGEIDLRELRGILKNEASNLPFTSEQGSSEVPPARVLADLFRSGILSELRLRDAVRFTYDPVAETLAQWWGARPSRRAASSG